jgi:hemerythrin-like domain-containing protein
MIKEHQLIREFILGLDKEANKDIFASLATLLSDHIRFEERQLFAYLEQILSKDQLDVIFTQLEENPVCDDEWTDEFWVRKR